MNEVCSPFRSERLSENSFDSRSSADTPIHLYQYATFEYQNPTSTPLFFYTRGYHITTPIDIFSMSFFRLRLVPRNLYSKQLTSRSTHPLFSSYPTANTRKMSSAAATPAAEKFEWLVILPDNEGALERRVSVRP